MKHFAILAGVVAIGLVATVAYTRQAPAPQRQAAAIPADSAAATPPPHAGGAVPAAPDTLTTRQSIDALAAVADDEAATEDAAALSAGADSTLFETEDTSSNSFGEVYDENTL